jgi:hypothetical protein
LGAVERLQTDVVLRDQLGADPARGLDFDTLFEDKYEGLFQALVLTRGEFRAYARAPGQQGLYAPPSGLGM